MGVNLWVSPDYDIVRNRCSRSLGLILADLSWALGIPGSLNKVFGVVGNPRKICIGLTTTVIMLKLMHHMLEKGIGPSTPTMKDSSKGPPSNIMYHFRLYWEEGDKRGQYRT